MSARDIDGTNDFDGITWIDFYAYILFCDNWMETKLAAMKAGTSW